jgi:hypothetical protein
MREAVAKLAKARKVKAAPLVAAGSSKADAPVKAAKVEADQERLSGRDAAGGGRAVCVRTSRSTPKTLTEALPPGVEAGDVLLQLEGGVFEAKGVQLVEAGGQVAVPDGAGPGFPV